MEDSGLESFEIAYNVYTQETIDEEMNQAMVAGATLVKAPQTVSDTITFEQCVLAYNLKNPLSIILACFKRLMLR